MAWSQQGSILTAVRDARFPEAAYIYREMHLTGFTGSRATARNILERERVAGNVTRSEYPHGNLGYAWKLTDAGHAFLAGAEVVGSLRADCILNEADGKFLDAVEKNAALTARVAELEAENEMLRAERDSYSAGEECYARDCIEAEDECARLRAQNEYLLAAAKGVLAHRVGDLQKGTGYLRDNEESRMAIAMLSNAANLKPEA